jgi:hypothetical protein
MSPRTICATCLLLLARTPGFAGTPSPTDTGASATTQAAGMVKTALRLELEGKNAERNALLRQVLELSPDQPQAHAHLGEINSDGTWLPYERIVGESSDQWQQWYLYCQRSETAGDSVRDHFDLANLARDWGMRDQERAHLERIVQLDWANEPARQRLGDVKVECFWVPREEAEAFARQLMRTRQELDRWGPGINALTSRARRTRNVAKNSVWSELKAIRDPSAIPAMETALAAGDEGSAEFYLEWLRRLDAWEASVALARQAVFSPSSGIRSSAQQFLRERRIDDYAPVLLGALRADPKFQSQLSLTPFGGLVYVENSSVETQHEYRTRRLAVLYGLVLNGIDIERSGIYSVPVFQDVTVPGRWGAVVEHLRRYYGGATQREGFDRSLSAELTNDRIMRTLASATGLSGPESPQDWWKWWNSYQAVNVDGVKPRRDAQYTETWFVDREVRRTPTSVWLGNSCFAAGTPVVTEYGPKAIEEIHLGDRVLSQDVESGELAFKPVFKTTVRPPVPLMKITTDRGDLVCTGGHPFWVNGESWLYARELQPGMRFHSIDGASEILAVADAGREDKAYNLIVADFHTYFAGDGKVLSHDNTPRAPTNALVPGLMPDYVSVGKAKQ